MIMREPRDSLPIFLSQVKQLCLESDKPLPNNPCLDHRRHVFGTSVINVVALQHVGHHKRVSKYPPSFPSHPAVLSCQYSSTVVKIRFCYMYENAAAFIQV